MWVEESGPDGGVAIVFLHGSMVAGWMWAEQAAALSAEYRTLVPDLPGIGASGSEQWTGFSGVADAVAGEIEARAPGGAHVVGLSLGGIIGLNLAVNHPEALQFTARVRRSNRLTSAPASTPQPGNGRRVWHRVRFSLDRTDVWHARPRVDGCVRGDSRVDRQIGDQGNRVRSVAEAVAGSTRRYLRASARRRW